MSSTITTPVIDTNSPYNVYDLVNHTIDYKKNNHEETYASSLMNILKKYHLWPSMQVKKFKNDENIVLLHNSYNIDNIPLEFKEMYDQCRSIVLDFSSYNNNTVVSYANNIPVRIDIQEYANNVNDSDRYQEAYDGTMITVYNYKDTWYFGTSSCPSVNNSKFAHPTKSHGDMFNEVLMQYFRQHFTDEEIENGNKKYIEDKLRYIFTTHMDPNIAYEFVILHYENNHIIDYSQYLGMNYKVLYHINSKNRITLVEVDTHNKPLAHLGILYPTTFNNLNDAYNHISHEEISSYGFIVKKATESGTKLYKISPKHVDYKENTDPCKPNVWHNILAVYMKNSKDFKIKDYIELYATDIQLPIDDKGREIDPTYLIHTMISTLKDVLYNLYVATTTYNPKTNRFRMNKELDKQFPPVIRFHLAQLRFKQQSEQYPSMIRATDVYHYLCRCNNIKNIRLLINFLATNVGYNISERSALCLTVLNNLLQ